MYGVKEIRYILSNKTIKESDKAEIEDALKDALMYAVADSGFKMHEDDAKYLKVELFKILVNKYHYLRLAEIKIAFRNGVQKVYGEFIGLSLASFSQFLSKYSSSQERAKAVIEQRPERMIEQHTPEPLDPMIRVKELYRDFKKSGTCDDIGNVAYTYLDREGKIDFTPEQKRKFMELAHAEMLVLFDPKKAKDLQELREKDRKFVALLQGKLEGLKKVKAMKLALIEHFKNNKYE